MSDPATITPISGEIMSGASGSARGPRPQADVVDAEFVTVVRTVPDQLAIPAASPMATPVFVAGLDILGKNQAPRTSAGAGYGFWAAGLLAACAAFWMAGGHSLARSFQFPDIVGSSSVQVASVTSEVRRSPQGAHLVIDGTLANGTSEAAEAPDLEIEVAAVGGGVTRYRLGNGGVMIEPQGTRKFSSRLTAPSDGVRSVSVTVAGGK